MSAIAGVFHPGTPKPVDRARVLAMADAQAHRGPDGAGVWTGHGIGLAHRRRSILKNDDVVQPLTVGELSVVLDGAIYNAAEVRSALERRDVRFDTASDAELLLQAWRAWGPAMLEQLNGDFVLALYDAADRRLFLARDRLGARPLHYVELSDGSVAFASELKGLLVHPLLRRAPDVRSIDDFLGLGYTPDDSCLIAGVRKMPAGHFLLFERGKGIPGPRRWWNPNFARAAGSSKDIEAELLDRLRSAVRLRLAADAWPGALLTGGVDSASVLALMAETSKQAVATCTIGASPATQDERAAAAGAAERFHARHVDRSLTADDVGPMTTLAAAFDEPVGAPAAVMMARLYQLAREQMTVALSGDGADEIFGGHSRYRRHSRQERIRSLLPAAVREGAPGRLGRALGMDGAEDYAAALAVTPFALRQTLFSSDVRPLLTDDRVEHRYAATVRAAPAAEPVGRAQYADMLWAVPGDILTRADRIGMAFGLETRQPLLDHLIVELAASLPPSVKAGRGRGKTLFRRAMQHYLPREITRRPHAQYIPPLDYWFSGPLADPVSDLSRSHRLRNWFDGEAIEQIVSAHRAGRGDHGRTIWQLLMLERSLKRLFG